MPLEALPEEIEQKIPGVFSMISYIVPVVGWEFAFSFLSFGPLIGVISMYRSRKRPDAGLMAYGMK